MNLIDARYWLEIWLGGRNVKSYLLPYVQSYATSDRASTAFRHTLGAKPMRWHSGLRNIPITVTGLSGQGFRLGTDRNGAPKFADGPTLFGELREFLRYYEKLCTTTQAQSDDGRPLCELVFRAPEEGDAWKLENVDLQPSRDAGSTRFSFAYTLSATGYASAVDAPAVDGFDGFIGSAKAYGQAATDFVDSASTYVGVANARVRGVRAALGAFLGPIRATSRLMREVSSLAYSTRSLSALPADYARAAFQAVQDAAAALMDRALTIPLGDRPSNATRRWYFGAMAELGEVRRKSLLALGLRIDALTSPTVDGAGASLATKLSPLKSASGAPSTTVTSYVVQTGDTLQGIAAAQLGDPSQAAVIAALNGMLDAGTLNDGSPLRGGVTLLLPSPAGVVTAISGGAAVQPDPYGVDLLLTADGDLLAAGDDPEDLSTIQGGANYLQALGARCRTVQGEHRVFPSYGIPATPGDPSLATTAGLLASQLRAQLAMDPRTATVVAVAIRDEGDTYWCTATVNGKLGGGITLTVPMEA